MTQITRLEYELTLHTPAFLGGALQSAEWRTPPLKALIREWWRMAMARTVEYDHGRLKHEEKALFGTAADDAGGDNHKSRVRLALAHWDAGKLKEWSDVGIVTNGRKKDKRPMSWLAYGPVEQNGQRLAHAPALTVSAGNTERNTLKIAIAPATQTTDALAASAAPAIETALQLIHWFGTIGGRSHNGWGSLALNPVPHDDKKTIEPLTHAALLKAKVCRQLDQCLDLDWPHAIGTDANGPLVWLGAPHADWKTVMDGLAHLKKEELKPEAGFTQGHPFAHAQNRLASTLRFKVQPTADGQVQALVYHTPCKPDDTEPNNLLGKWQKVHRYLDDTLTRLP